MNKRTALVCAVYAGLSVLMCAPLFVQPNGVGHYDWDQHLFYYASVLKSVVEYGQWPFWNPWYCGGNVLWQNPQIALLSPAYPLALLMSLPLAMKMNIVIHYWMGFIGMHLLLRRVAGVRFWPIVVYLGCVFVASGGLALHIAEGHSTFLVAFYLPLQLFWLCRAISGGRLRDGLLAGGMLALMVINGGLQIVAITVVGVGALALMAAVTRQRWQPLLVAVLCGIGGFAYAAPKLVPVLAYLATDRFLDDRTMVPNDFMTVEMVAHAYVDPSQNRRSRFAEHLYNWQEYGNYIGVPAALLIVSALVWMFFATGHSPTRWLGVSLAVTSALFFALSLGEFSRFAPATLVHAVPFLSRYRVPSRYTIGFVLFAATLIGWPMLRALMANRSTFICYEPLKLAISPTPASPSSSPTPASVS